MVAAEARAVTTTTTATTSCASTGRTTTAVTGRVTVPVLLCTCPLPAIVRGCHGVHKGGIGSPRPRCAASLASTPRCDLPEGEADADAPGSDDFGSLKPSLSANARV